MRTGRRPRPAWQNGRAPRGRPPTASSGTASRRRPRRRRSRSPPPPRTAELPVRAAPPTITAIPGSTPTRKIAPPIVAVPTAPSPQRSRTTATDRLIASLGPRPSSAITGTTKNVATVHARFASPPTIELTTLPAVSRSSACSAVIAAPTTSRSADQARMLPKRARAAATPSENVVSSPSSAFVAHAASATAQNCPIARMRYAPTTKNGSATQKESAAVPNPAPTPKNNPATSNAQTPATIGNSNSERSPLTTAQLCFASAQPRPMRPMWRSVTARDAPHFRRLSRDPLLRDGPLRHVERSPPGRPHARSTPARKKLPTCV